MRFSEALAITPGDFDFAHQTVSVSKTWNYKEGGGFAPTKNRSSVRKIQIDWQVVMQFASLVKELPQDKPIFVLNEKVYNSTVNDILARLPKKLTIPCYFRTWTSAHTCVHTSFCRRFTAKRGKTSWPRQYDYYAENISAYNSGT